MSTLVLHALIDERTEAAILDRIVDAMVDSHDELQRAGRSEWNEVLRDACRAKKWEDTLQV